MLPVEDIQLLINIQHNFLEESLFVEELSNFIRLLPLTAEINSGHLASVHF